MENDQATIIRPAKVDDIPLLISMERQCPAAAHWTEQQYRNLFVASLDAPHRLALVATGGTSGGLLGFVVALHSASEWELENVVVALSDRRRGIGRLLMEALLDEARQNGEAVFLEVRESNMAARRLYEKLGFAETGRRRGYYANPPEDAVLYSKTPV